MTKFIKYFMFLFVALSPSFIVYTVTIQPVSAEICHPGQYAKPAGNGKFNCENAETKEKSNQVTEIDKTKKYFGALAASIAGIALGVSVLMTVYAGYLYTVSEGDAEKIKKAKFHIVAAGGGIIISGLSFIIYGMISNIIGI
jgi:hypothetical protein